MLTRSKKRTLAGICRPMTLPAAVLRSIGSFLKTSECFVAVRTCKNNEGLKPLLTSIEKIVSRSEKVLPGFVSVIEPSLISSIGCSVKVLEVNLYAGNAGALVQLLPRLGSLQQFQISLKIGEMRLLRQVFPSIPQRVRCLTLSQLDAEALRDLGEASTAGCLPVLEELAFPLLQVGTVDDMAGLQIALMAPSSRKNLKMLLLDFPTSWHQKRGYAWLVLESVLNVEDQTSGILSRLETLALMAFIDWGMLAKYLLPGERLPGLKEVYSPNSDDGRSDEMNDILAWRSVSWYEMDSQTIRSWFELLHRRPLQTFNREISFNRLYQWHVPAFVIRERILQLFRCLSNPSLEPKCISTIGEVNLICNGYNEMCSETFEAFAGAIRWGNLRSLESLELVIIPTCSSESLASLGEALDRAFLPCLTSFSFRVEDPPGVNLGHVNLEEPSLLLKSFFGSISTGGLDNLHKLELYLSSPGTGIVLGALAGDRPNCFRRLPELWLSEVFPGNIEKMALVFEAAIFPCVERGKISELDKDFCEGMPRLLRALSDYTNIKELHVQDTYYSDPDRRFVRPLLKMMLSLLSESTSSALFPSLQILKITIPPHVFDGSSYYMSAYIEPLLLSIKAVRPPNLNTIILVGGYGRGGEKRI